jgi:hypothetical protein
VYIVATTVSVAYRVGARHMRLVGWVGLAAPQYRRHTGILYATVKSIAVVLYASDSMAPGSHGPTTHKSYPRHTVMCTPGLAIIAMAYRYRYVFSIFFAH